VDVGFVVRGDRDRPTDHDDEPVQSCRAAPSFALRHSDSDLGRKLRRLSRTRPTRLAQMARIGEFDAREQVRRGRSGQIDHR
jgi:hypothetical protein